MPDLTASVFGSTSAPAARVAMSTHLMCQWRPGCRRNLVVKALTVGAVPMHVRRSVWMQVVTIAADRSQLL